ncbi:transmembrane protein, putative [Medicago truncatula]|uniref:Transmembrane protein, putative n=1 Tax=Medicago truncatula TaxID=3880 RepID=A0A072UJQ4_MEDTR|nr:transmembrane protein, putative [Medicago truncatula]
MNKKSKISFLLEPCGLKEVGEREALIISRLIICLYSFKANYKFVAVAVAAIAASNATSSLIQFK